MDLTAGTVLNGTGPNGEVHRTEDETVSNETVSNGGTESKDGLNEVELTEDGTISNGGTKPKDGLNGPNEVDPNGDVESNKDQDGSFSSPLGNLVTYVTGEKAETAWQGVNQRQSQVQRKCQT